MNRRRMGRAGWFLPLLVAAASVSIDLREARGAETGSLATPPLAEEIERAAAVWSERCLSSIDDKIEFRRLARRLGGVREGVQAKVFEAVWARIPSKEKRGEFAEGWAGALLSEPEIHEDHFRILLILAREESLEGDAFDDVQRRSSLLALIDFKDDRRACVAWLEANQGRAPSAIFADSAKAFVARAANADALASKRESRLVRGCLEQFREAAKYSEALRAAGVADLLERWIKTGGAPGADNESGHCAVASIWALDALAPGDDELSRIVLPLMKPGMADHPRLEAIAMIGARRHEWAREPLLEQLRLLIDADAAERRQFARELSFGLAQLDERRAIPLMLDLIEADGSPEVARAVGQRGLRRLLGVEPDDSHDAAWWREWRAKNQAALDAAIAPPAPPPPPSEPEDIPPSELIRIGGDERMRYFLIGDPAKAPAAGAKMLVVLPGGGGGPDFNPFVRRILKQSLGEDWVILQLVAPTSGIGKSPPVVWPSESLPFEKSGVATHQLLLAALKDAQARVRSKPGAVYVLAWSSGGPAAYASLLAEDSPVAGAFIAMSVFRPDPKIPAERAAGKRVFLYQSPDDKVTRIRFAREAQAWLEKAGASVEFREYPGGHGWHGPIWPAIREGIAWIERAPEAKPPAP